VEPARAIGQEQALHTLAGNRVVDEIACQCVEQALHTLAGNLVDNAIRYTPPGGCVVVEIWSEEGGAVLDVKDTGPGIPAEERQRVFDRFYRLPGSGVQGSGLGLAIVKQIADAHRAEITLGETENDRGLEVTVRFPKAPAG